MKFYKKNHCYLSHGGGRLGDQSSSAGMAPPYLLSKSSAAPRVHPKPTSGFVPGYPCSGALYYIILKTIMISDICVFELLITTHLIIQYAIPLICNKASF